MEQPKISKKRLAEEMDVLRRRLGEIESQVEDSLGEAADTAKRKLREIVGNEPVNDAGSEHLIRVLAELKSKRRGDDQAITHWLEAEEEVDVLLKELQLRD